MQGILPCRSSKVCVLIVSRDDRSSYEWLISNLLTIPCVGHVQPVYISSTNMNLIKYIKGITVIVLYHTKNRGRVNITDVTDSIYDRELEYLSRRFGKENVIVVIDDLDAGSSEQKTRILQNQPSIERLAKDLFLFTTMEKVVKPSQSKMLIQIKDFIEEKGKTRILQSWKGMPVISVCCLTFFGFGTFCKFKLSTLPLWYINHLFTSRLYPLSGQLSVLSFDQWLVWPFPLAISY
ncbi:Hypothetical predicted protein [Pelobates cultripes]|uniref:Uncharacterized protein n=1 Tax=Pelobates cultripes TaxID=61616 RepID=A0AAD1STX2_PELCU|nr:Hypothetical predicted protein [Pelobates cultripes]